MQESTQRIALPALGRGRRSRPARKMIRRRKLLEIAAESPASGARFVGKNCGMQDTPPKNQKHTFNWFDFTRATFFYKPDFAETKTAELPKRRAKNLQKPLLKTDFAKNYFARKNEPGKKARTKLTKTFAKNLEANFSDLTLPNKT